VNGDGRSDPLRFTSCPSLPHFLNGFDGPKTIIAKVPA
jgi:hypothetical protein